MTTGLAHFLENRGPARKLLLKAWGRNAAAVFSGTYDGVTKQAGCRGRPSITTREKSSGELATRAEGNAEIQRLHRIFEMLLKKISGSPRHPGAVREFHGQ